ncbi:MAG: hypothetical protein Q9210_004706 [Variospora velana]
MDRTIVSDLPILSAEPVIQLDPDGKALLGSDLCCLYTTIDGQIVDMVLHSNPGKTEVKFLWQEGFGTATSMLNLVEASTLEIDRVAGTTRFNNAVLPARRYRNTTTTTFQALREQLEYCHRVAQSKLAYWEVLMEENEIQVQSGMSRRPMGEIVMEAMLCTRGPVNMTQARSSLESLPSIRQQNSTQSPESLNFSLSRLGLDQNLFHMGLNLNDPTAYLNFFPIAGSNGQLFTGSTLIQWGSALGGLLVQGSNDSLHVWFRKERQMRFSREQQKHLDHVIKKFLAEYDLEMKEESRRQLIDIIKTSQPLGTMLTEEQLQTHRLVRRYTEAEIRAMGGGEKRHGTYQTHRQLKLRMPLMRRHCLGKLNDRFGQKLPTRLQVFYKRHPMVGQAYAGHTLALKRKCPVCTSVFPFGSATGVEAMPAQNWERVAELDPNRSAAPKGCCAEALVAAAFVSAGGLDDELSLQIQTNESHQRPQHQLSHQQQQYRQQQQLNQQEQYQRQQRQHQQHRQQ